MNDTKVHAAVVAESGGAAEEADNAPPADRPLLTEARHRVEELETVLEAVRGQRILIAIKGYPDPDSIGSALAHQYLCRGHGVEADIVHFEDLSHPENRALVKRLEIDMTLFSEGVDLSAYAGYCCVDTQTADLPVPVPSGLRCLSLVDHHKWLGPVDAEFVDVREDAGSTCAIYCEYLQEGRVTLEARTPEVTRLATAMMHGIRTDTDDFLLARPIDFEASAYLAPYVDRELLAVISRESISSKSMDILQIALDKKVIKNNYIIAGVGYVRDEDRDGIGEAADYMLRREGVDTVLVYGIVGGTTIDGSFRTTSNTVDPDKWMKDLFGCDAAGKAYGGGRRDKGGFQIPLGIFARCSNRDLLWETVRTTIEDIFFEKIGASRDED
ncbi:MAG: bifunctional oligoribonuclease/PAP phosphatase NrnA [Deltaproteobacteria bacterium]|nr:MAG: bifunctional oligoribonuclease/PAP phosphatase NrnA [Deltaproteobacteria bacterium]